MLMLRLGRSKTSKHTSHQNKATTVFGLMRSDGLCTAQALALKILLHLLQTHLGM